MRFYVQSISAWAKYSCKTCSCKLAYKYASFCHYWAIINVRSVALNARFIRSDDTKEVQDK